MTSTILLFDIDGTLISTGGAGRTAFITAFEEVTGAVDAYDSFSFAGRTDRGIVRAGLDAAGLANSDETIDAVLERYLELLVDNVSSSDGFVIHPWVHEAVRAVSEGSAAIGLGTGNVERGARIKLERAQLNEFFGFGGFGCDAEARHDLIRAGAERGAALLGRPLSACDLVVIGDTTRDIEAAQAVGGQCLTVGTGGMSATQSASAGAKWHFDTLEHAMEVLVTLAR